MLQKIHKYLRRINNLFITKKLSLQLETLSTYNNNVMTWHSKDNNKHQVIML